MFQKTLIRYWWFIGLLFIAGYFLSSNIIRGKQLAKETNFSIDKSKHITHIRLISSNDTLILSKKEDELWLVNNQPQANLKAINEMLWALSRIQTAGAVPLVVGDSIRRVIETSGVRVDVYSNHKALKNFHIISSSTLNLNAVGFQKGASTLYKLEIPNFDGCIANFFSVSTAYWMLNKISLPQWSSIIAVEVEIPKQPEQSFRVDIIGNDVFRLFDLHSGIVVSSFDSTKVADFLYGFSSINYYSIASLTASEREAVLSIEPDFIYNLYTAEGKSHQLTIFPIPVEEYIDEFGRPVNFDLNKLYLAHSVDYSIYVVNYIDIYYLMRGLSYFCSTLSESL